MDTIMVFLFRPSIASRVTTKPIEIRELTKEGTNRTAQMHNENIGKKCLVRENEIEIRRGKDIRTDCNR